MSKGGLLALIPKSVPAAKRALAMLERELNSAKTYKAIRRVARAAEALKLLFEDIREIREGAERTIIGAEHRIATELRAVPKAGGPGRGKKQIAGVRNVSGRAATGIAKDVRARLGALGKATLNAVMGTVAKLHEAGKEASKAAVLRELKGEEIKTKRADYEKRADKGAKLVDLVAMAERGDRFGVIYADPPWEFKVYSGRGKQRSAERHYDVSSLDAIKALPVEALAAKDCALLLWGVWPELPGALDVIRAWGFEFKTLGFVWIKTVSPQNDSLFTGMGYWSRANSEPLLLATRGSPTRVAMDVHQIIMSPVGGHSEKPVEARRRIERLLLGPYLELFARGTTPGWSAWGNEIEQAAEAAE